MEGFCFVSIFVGESALWEILVRFCREEPFIIVSLLGEWIHDGQVLSLVLWAIVCVVELENPIASVGSLWFEAGYREECQRSLKNCALNITI